VAPETALNAGPRVSSLLSRSPSVGSKVIEPDVNTPSDSEYASTSCERVASATESPPVLSESPQLLSGSVVPRLPPR
jgi:hypothetical protein